MCHWNRTEVRLLAELKSLKKQNKNKEQNEQRRCEWLMLQSFDPFPQGVASYFFAKL